MLSIENLKFRYKRGADILRDISFTVPEGNVISILGPNGTGKTTLLRCILGLQKPTGGKILFNGTNLCSLSPEKRSQIVAYVPQSSRLTFPFSVFEVVMMGRVSQFGFGRAPSAADKEIVEKSLAEMNALRFRDKSFQELSGGEKQLVLIARALAQQAKVLVLDEPTASLDFSNQARVLRLIRGLAEKGYTVLMTTHSPDQAFLVSENTVLLKDGLVFAEGKSEEVVTSDNLSALYNMQIKVMPVDLLMDEKQIKVCIPVL